MTVQKTVDGDNALSNEGVTASTNQGSDTTKNWYKTSWDNTTDNSKRLKIIVDGMSEIENPDDTANTVTFVNITTGITPSALVDLEGTALVSYDVTSLADALSSTDIDVYLTHGTAAAGKNASVDGSASGGDRVICLESSGNEKAQIVDMDDLTGGDDCGDASYDAKTERVGVHGQEDVWGSALTTNKVSYAFKFTHPSKEHLATNDTCNTKDCYGEYAIAVDIINFDQDNATKTHNGIYRIEAVETGESPLVDSSESSELFSVSIIRLFSFEISSDTLTETLSSTSADSVFIPGIIVVSFSVTGLSDDSCSVVSFSGAI